MGSDNLIPAARDMSEARGRKLADEGMSNLSRQRASAPRMANLIYKALLDDIISMRLRPNERLSERELVDRFGVSRTPVREAILRLADEGLVVIFPQAGTFVARIPVRLLCESIMIRRSLELLMVENACVVRTDADILALDENLNQMERLGLKDGIEDFHRLDSEFHALIGRVADYPTVMATTEHIRTQIDRYRIMTLPQAGRFDRVIDEHRAVRNGIATGDVAAACNAMSLHLGKMLEEIAALDNLDREYFNDDRGRGPSNS